MQADSTKRNPRRRRGPIDRLNLAQLSRFRDRRMPDDFYKTGDTEGERSISTSASAPVGKIRLTM
jgi:hypothetical protein